MPTVTISSYLSFYVEKDGIDYLVVHNAEVADSISVDFRVGQTYVAPNYFIYRDAVYFNLALLPNDAFVTSAVLKLYGRQDLSDTDFDIVIVSGSGLSLGGEQADYGVLVSKIISFGSFNSSQFVLNAYNEISLNSLGIDEINLHISGNVVFGIRSSRDISSIVPGGGEIADFDDYSLPNPPKLVLTYTTGVVGESPGTLKVRGNYLHYVDSGGVERRLLGDIV